MLFRSGQDKNSIRWRLFQGFQKGIESLIGKHVHLVNDKHLVFTLLGLKTHLLGKRADMFNGVVRRRI